MKSADPQGNVAGYPMNLPTLRIRIPLLGDCLLVPHPADQDPGATKLGYVLLEGEQTIRRSLRLKGDWRDYKNRPFTKAIVAWYGMEKPDGTPVF